DHGRRRQHQRQRSGLQPGLPLLGHAARRADEPQGPAVTSRIVLAAAAAVLLVLGAAPGARAAGHGSGATAPGPSVDQTIDRLTSKTRREGQDRAAWTPLRGASMHKARRTAARGSD